ncbi:MAG: LysM peptidoglycan-binding domain-containing protein [Myxococcota bacterium]
MSLLSLLLRAALAQSPELDPEAPAAEPGEPSIWEYIEGAESAPPAPAVIEASRELVEERMAELAYSGVVGAEPPVAYYLDPLAALSADPLRLDEVDPSEFDIPIVVNEHVKRWMTYFLGPGRKYYARYLERSTKWMPMMHRAIEARGLPRDLVYLSMIESGFSTGATSYASAAGLWQFMSYTGKDYGLRIDWWVDERRDPEAATAAALKYLSDLHKMFAGDWWLAWASYNGGQGRVMNATRRYGTTDFWKIAERDYLHTETENYVPKLIAAAIIGKHPERYGFVGIPYQAEFRFESVEVPASTSVEVLAKCAGMTLDEFVEYNPALRRFALPPDPEVQKVRIKTGGAVAFAEAFAKVPPEERLTLQRHVVKRGESLAGIARKYGVSVEEIAKVNRIGNVNRITVGMELVVPVQGKALTSTAGASVTEPKAEAKPEPKPAPKAEALTHVVKAGDTLSGVATKYGVTVKDLQGWNKLDGTTIVIGQKLTVKGGAAPPAAKTLTYTVRRGDTLGGIAEKYGCSVADLKSWNGLKGSTIYPGQKLKIKE